MKKATKIQVKEKAVEMETKYCNLVWYARKSEDNMKLPAVRAFALQLEEKFSEEISQLKSGNADFQHGFNSGCLAAYRHILSMMESSVEEADEMFPELDS